MSLVIIPISILGSVLSAQLTIKPSNATFRYLLTFGIFLVLQTIFSLVYNVVLYPIYLSPLRHLPSPKQAPFWRRLAKEPGPRILCKWVNEIPNDGLIRYFGIFNCERVLVTRPQGCREVLQTQAYNYIKFPWALEIMSQAAGSLCILVAPPKKHKVG